jgi:hypothetical protein
MVNSGQIAILVTKMVLCFDYLHTVMNISLNESGFSPDTDLSSGLGDVATIPETDQQLENMLNNARGLAYSSLLANADPEVQGMAEMLLGHEMLMGMGTMSEMSTADRMAAKNALVKTFMKTRGLGDFVSMGILDLLRGGLRSITSFIPGLNKLAEPISSALTGLAEKPIRAVVGGVGNLIGRGVSSITGVNLADRLKQMNSADAGVVRIQ